MKADATTISELGEFHMRTGHRDFEVRPVTEKLFRWSEAEGQSGLYHHSMLEFQGRTSLENDDVIETLFWCPERKEFFLLRNYRRDGDVGETGKTITPDEAVRWSIDRLMGPKVAEFATEALTRAATR